MDKVLLQKYFNAIQDLLKRHRYRPDDIYNMDETGYAIGTTPSTRVLVLSQNKMLSGAKAVKSVAGRQEWVTTMKCVSAAGRALSPLVIYKGNGAVNQNWLPDNADLSWAWRKSPTGWSNNKMALEWLINVFDCQTRSQGQSKRPEHR